MIEYLILMLMIMVLLKSMNNFGNKLMVLILMEALFMLTIMSQMFAKSSNLSLMFLMNIMIFMVLDSTLGISILISSSRNSIGTSQSFRMI